MKWPSGRFGRATVWAVAIGAASLAAAQAPNEFARIEAIYGPADCSAATGFGGLTVGCNAYGRVTTCKWPTPGGPDQIQYETRSKQAPDLGVPADHGMMWAIRLADRTLWLTGAPWQATQAFRHEESRLIETAGTLAASAGTVATPAFSAHQLLFVHPALPVLVAQITLKGLDEAPLVFWYANLTPCTRQVAELPLGDWAFDAANDFASYVVRPSCTMLHFRPDRVTAADWRAAEAWAADSDRAAPMTRFGEGVWIAYTAQEEVAAFQCGTENTPSSAFVQACSGALSNARAAAGACNSAIAIRPRPDESSFTATVLTAFGKNAADAMAALDVARQRPFAVLVREAEEAARSQIRGALVPNTRDPEILALHKRCLLTLAAATDQYTGGVARAPVCQPPLALDFPSRSAWATLAFDTVGLHDLAEKHAMFCVQAVRSPIQNDRNVSKQGKPAGSLAAGLYTDGQEAVPDLILEPEAAAWSLFALVLHGSFLDEAARVTLFDRAWPHVDLVGEFLAGWADARTGAPLSSFEGERLRDARDPELLVAVHAGLRAALHIALALRQERPEWRRRLEETEPLLRQACFDAAGAVLPAAPTDPASECVAPPWLLWATRLAPPDSQAWKNVIDVHLKALPSMEGRKAAEALYLLSVLARGSQLRGDGALLAAIREQSAGAVRKALGYPAEAPLTRTTFPEAYTAALCLLGIHTLYDGPAPFLTAPL